LIQDESENGLEMTNHEDQNKSENIGVDSDDMGWQQLKREEFSSHAGGIRVLWTGRLDGFFRRCQIHDFDKWKTIFEGSFIPRYKRGNWDQPDAEIFRIEEYCNHKDLLREDGIYDIRLNDTVKIITAYRPQTSTRLIVDGLHHAAAIQINLDRIHSFPEVNVIEFSSVTIESIFYADFPHILKRFNSEI
jgi:hypothetical protein